jgi:hypothetical protein
MSKTADIQASERGMPAVSAMVAETLDTFGTDKSRSSLLDLDRQVLEAVSMLVVDKDHNLNDGLALLREQLAEAAPSQSAYYRFAADLRDRFDEIRRRYRTRLVRLAVEDSTAGNEDLANVLTSQVLRLCAERAVDADDLGQLEGRELGGMIAVIDGWTKARFKGRELELKAAEAEGKAQKLEAELALARQRLDDLPRRVREIERQLKAAQQALETPTPGGARKASSLFAAIRQELVDLSSTPGKPGNPEKAA